MRLSRKAGLLACGVKWIKYVCLKEIDTTTDYTLGPQQVVSQGWDLSGEKYFQGLSDITWNREAGTVYASGDQSFCNMANPGVVYEDNGVDGKSIYGYSVRSDGFWHIFTKTVRKETITTITYTVNRNVGTVRASNGEYPDAKNGYMYVTVYNGYTIMQDKNGNYFAYEKVG